jgi:hypothetical protein
VCRYPPARRLVAQLEHLAPGVYESAGKQHPAGSRRGNEWLRAMLVEAAGSIGRMKGRNYLSAQHARLTKRCAQGHAQVAVAHNARRGLGMLTGDEPYRDLGADWLARRDDEAHARRLVAQLEHLGHTVVLETPSPNQTATPATAGGAIRYARGQVIHGSVLA